MCGYFLIIEIVDFSLFNYIILFYSSEYEKNINMILKYFQ